MTSWELFEKMREEFLAHEEKIMGWKAGEYADDKDRLKNFRQVASFTGTTMSVVALMYLLKHIQAIANAVETDNYVWAWEKEGGEGAKQRIADARNYLLLLAACMEEEHDDDG